MDDKEKEKERLINIQATEYEIDEILATPPALCQQQSAKSNISGESSVAWFTQWNTSQRIRIIIIIFLSSLIASISYTIYYPCLNAVYNEFSPHKEVLAFVSYGTLFLWAITLPIWGGLSDRTSRKIVQLICLFLLFISSLAIMFTWSIWFFVLSNFVMSISASGIPAVSMRIIFEILPPSKRGLAVSFFLSSAVASIIVGPVLSGIMDYYVDWRLCYLILAIFTLIMLILQIFLVPETLNKDKKVSDKPILQIFKQLSSAEFMFVSSLISLSSAFLFLIYLMIATVFPSKYDLNSVIIGSIYLGIGISLGIGAGLGAGITFLLSKKYDIGGRIILPVIILYLLAFGSMILGWSLSYDGESYVSIIVIIICSLLRGSILPGLYTYCIELKPKKAFTIIETLTVIQFLSEALFQMLGTILGALIDYPLAFVAVGSLMILCGIPVIVYLIKRLRKRRLKI